jgi:hypothetical protein
VVRDVQNNVQTIIGWKNGSANPISSAASN